MTVNLLSLTSGSTLPQLAMSTGNATSTANAQGQADFGSVLQNILGGAAQTLRQGEAAALAGVQGTMPMQDVVEQVMAAERTLQTAIGVRDKFVSAYLEISRMQI